MRRVIICCIMVFAFASALRAQVTPRVAGMESNPQYMQLIQKEKELQNKRDSLNNLLTKARADLRAITDPAQRAQAGPRILKLESAVFDVRNEIGIVSGQINVIEQEYIVSSLGGMPAMVQIPTDTMPSKPAVLGSGSMAKYLTTNLSAEDLTVWRKACAWEAPAAGFVKDYLTNYPDIKHASQEYAAATASTRADSIYNQYKSLAKLNATYADTVGVIWGYVFDNKTYLCNLLMDKANNSDYLTWYSTRAEEVRSQLAQQSGSYESDIIGFYPTQKTFTLECEIRIAQAANDSRKVDSLRNAITIVQSGISPMKIVIEPRSFIAYQDVKIGSLTAYSAAKPIPALEVYPHGSVYRILLGTFQKAQLPSVFRGAAPLCVERLEDGRYRYYAGVYATLAQAEVGVALLKKTGFRAPEIVVWNNGQMANLTSSTSVKADKGVTFRIEIVSRESTLAAPVRDMIIAVGNGSDISRIASTSDDGSPQYTFIVGPFDSKSAAESLAQAIRVKQSGLAVTVAETPVN